MSEAEKVNHLGILLKELLHERSMSMRKLSERTEIDTATISRIVNGKRKANLQHLEKFSACLEIPIMDLFKAAGYPTEIQQQENPPSDMHTSVEVIQSLIESSNLYDNEFSIEAVDQQLANYRQFSQTQEGKNNILRGFDEKLEKVGSIGPFINHLKTLYEKFHQGKGTRYELAIIGSALLYFIIPVDVIPDYIFPIGYLDDAIAVQIALTSLAK